MKGLVIFQVLLFKNFLSIKLIIFEYKIVHFFVKKEAVVLDLFIDQVENEWIIETEPNRILFISFIADNVDELQLLSSLTVLTKIQCLNNKFQPIIFYCRSLKSINQTPLFFSLTRRVFYPLSTPLGTLYQSNSGHHFIPL